jgi:hypothetical protein
MEGGASFWLSGWQADTGGGHGGAGDEKEEERAQQGNIGEGRGNGFEPLSAGPEADKRGAREDARTVRTNTFWAQI